MVLNTALAVLFYLMMAGILALSWLSMRHSAKQTDAAIKAAEAAKLAAEAANRLAVLLEKRQT